VARLCTLAGLLAAVCTRARAYSAVAPAESARTATRRSIVGVLSEVARAVGKRRDELLD
jgi:hypothetical protein